MVVTRAITPPRPLSPHFQEVVGRDESGPARRDVNRVHGEGSRDFEPKTLESLLQTLPCALRSADVVVSRRSLAAGTDPDFPAAYSAEASEIPDRCPPLPCALEALTQAGKDPTAAKKTLLDRSHYNLKVEGLHLRECPSP